MSSKLSYGLLLDDVKGYRRLSAFVNKDQLEGEITHKVVLKGSLLVQLDKTTIKAFKEILSCIVNYMVYTIPSTEVYVMVGSHKVRTITNEQRDFLYGIEGLSKRLEVYKRLGWIEKLTEGSEVYVTITTTPYPVKGVVRWIGKLAGEYGTKFGIELLENKGEEEINYGVYKGHHYFSCKSTNCAVFVAVDKLTNPETANAAKLMQSAQSTSKNEIKLGSLVTFYDSDNCEERGIVRWIESDNSDVHNGTKIIGIEVKKRITFAVPHNVVGMSHYFTPAEKWHSKVFLPVTFVRKYTPPAQRRNDSNSPKSMLDLVESGDEDNYEDAPESPTTDLPSNNRYESDKQEVYHECHDDPNSPTLIRKSIIQQFNIGSQVTYEGRSGVIKWLGYLPGCNEPMAGLEMSKQYIIEECEDGYWEGKLLYKCPPLRGTFIQLNQLQLANRSKQGMLQEPLSKQSEVKKNDHKSSASASKGAHLVLESGCAVELGKPPDTQYGVIRWMRSIKGVDQAYVEMEDGSGQTFPLDVLRPDSRFDDSTNKMEEKSNGDSSKATKRPNIDDYNRLPRLTTGLYSGPTCSMVLNQNPYKLEEGSAIKYDYPPKYGVIKWIGIIPGWDKTLYAGVEMDEVVDGSTDGIWIGKRYFESEPGKGKFIRLSELRPSERPPGKDFTKDHSITQRILETGSLVQFGDPVQYGVIKRIETAVDTFANIAEVETEAGQSLKIPLSELQSDKRFIIDIDVKKINPLEKFKAKIEDCVRPSSRLLLKEHTGLPKGIQGQQNSCYLDATLYGMFAFSDAFDGLFLMKRIGQENQKLQEIIQQDIVYPLRMYHIVPQESVLLLRAFLQKSRGFTLDEKDPEEFLNILLKHVCSPEPYLKIRRSTFVEEEFFVQLFLEPHVHVMSDTESLLHAMFMEQGLVFDEYPTKLLLQVPRYGKHYKVFQRIIPKLEMDVRAICNLEQPCLVCGRGGRITCAACYHEKSFVNGIKKPFFCDTCSRKWHNHNRRKHHKLCAKDCQYFSTGILQLLSVICIETHHYVCFNRITGSGKDEWVFFDSMAERLSDGFNRPEVKCCTDILNEWVYGDKDIINTTQRPPELARRFVQDVYLCIYIDEEGTMYR